MSQQKNKSTYVAPSVKAVSFMVEEGFLLSGVVLFNSMSTTGYRNLFGEGGRSSMNSFWDNGSGNHFGSTNPYHTSNDWQWD